MNRETHHPGRPYVRLEQPLDVALAATLFGEDVIPWAARDEPDHYLITHAAVDRSYVLAALNARYFEERTRWRLIHDPEDGRGRLLWRCPMDGQLIYHCDEHWDKDDRHRVPR